GGDLVRRKKMRVRERDGHAHVDDVRAAAGAAELLDCVHLLLAAAVRVVGGDGDAVLGVEAVKDGAVVRPVARQRDHVELALRLSGLHESVHATAVGSGLCCLRSTAAGGAAATAAPTRGYDDQCHDGQAEVASQTTQLHPSIPSKYRPRGLCDPVEQSNDGYSLPTMQGHRSPVRLISVSRRLNASGH